MDARKLQVQEGKTWQGAGTTGLGTERATLQGPQPHTHQLTTNRPEQIHCCYCHGCSCHCGVCKHGHTIEQETCGDRKTTLRIGPYLPPCLGMVYFCCCLPQHTPGQQAHELPGNPLDPHHISHSHTGTIDACGVGWALGIQTQVDRLARQAFYILSHDTGSRGKV